MGSSRQDDPSPPDPLPQDAGEAAILWTIVRRDNPDDPAMDRRFRQWLGADPAHRRAWEEMSHVDDRLAEVEPAFAVRIERPPVGVAAGAGAAPVAASALFPPARWRRLGLIAAFALVLAVLLAPGLSMRLRADHQSGVAEVRNVTLADGSIVQLAPLSAIAIDYAKGRRDVTLLKGEAFFTVKPDPGRPFHVTGKQVAVTVLGTVFDVREAESASGGAFVGVEHGRVRVAARSGTSSALLVGGQAAAVDASGLLHRRAIPPLQVGAWRQQQLIVENEPLTHAIARLRPWFGGVIVTRGEALARQRLTGVFNLADPVDALRAMARAYGGRVTTIGGWLVIYSQD